MKNHIKRIIKEAVNDAFNAQMRGSLDNMLVSDNYNVLTISDESDYNKWSQSVWDMLVVSYRDIQGLKSYRNFSDFLKKKHIIQIVLDDTQELLACAMYRRIEGSLKMVACGCNQTKDGKDTLQAIIKHNIEKVDLHYWAEVSGAIEY